MGLFSRSADIKKLEAGGDTKKLIKVLKGSDSQFHLEAACAMLRLGPAAMDMLLDSLLNSPEEARARIVRVVGQTGDPLAAKLLSAFLADRSPVIRRLSISALESLGAEIAEKPLMSALRSPYSGVRVEALAALDRISGEGRTGVLGTALNCEPPLDIDVRREAIEALVSEGGERALQALVDALGGPNFDVKLEVIEALGRIGGQLVMSQFIAALKDRHSAIRKAAAVQLRRAGWQPTADESGAAYWLALNKVDECIAMGQVGVAAIIADFVTSRDNHQRENLATYLVPLGQPAVKGLISALADKNEDVRWYAANTLGKIGDPQAVQPLLGLVNDEKPHVWSEAVRALGRIPSPQVLGPLVTLLKDEDRYVRQTAEGALEGLLDAVSSADDPQARIHVVETLSGLRRLRNRRTDTERLTVLLKDADDGVRAAAVGVLGDCPLDGLGEIIPLVIGLMRDDQAASVRGAAGSALDRVKTTMHLAATPKEAGNFPSDPDTAAEAIRLMISIGDFDKSAADSLLRSIPVAREIASSEDTSHGGFTCWQIYGGWIRAGEEYLEAYSK